MRLLLILSSSCLTALLVANQIAASSLFPGPKLPAGERPQAVAVADFDGDTIPDRVMANPLSDDVTVLLGNGDGTFQAAQAFPAGYAPYGHD